MGCARRLTQFILLQWVTTCTGPYICCNTALSNVTYPFCVFVSLFVSWRHVLGNQIRASARTEESAAAHGDTSGASTQLILTEEASGTLQKPTKKQYSWLNLPQSPNVIPSQFLKLSSRNFIP
jgi:hypothetical protein